KSKGLILQAANNIRRLPAPLCPLPAYGGGRCTCAAIEAIAAFLGNPAGNTLQTYCEATDCRAALAQTPCWPVVPLVLQPNFPVHEAGVLISLPFCAMYRGLKTQAAYSHRLILCAVSFQ